MAREIFLMSTMICSLKLVINMFVINVVEKAQLTLFSVRNVMVRNLYRKMTLFL
jgi:hypothetical protein